MLSVRLRHLPCQPYSGALCGDLVDRFRGERCEHAVYAGSLERKEAFHPWGQVVSPFFRDAHSRGEYLICFDTDIFKFFATSAVPKAAALFSWRSAGPKNREGTTFLRL